LGFKTVKVVEVFQEAELRFDPAQTPAWMSIVLTERMGSYRP
jgi:hypothetical protein